MTKNTFKDENAKEQIAIIIGAGPAGLTAAYELIKKTKIKPIIFESKNIVGGISATLEYKGNRMDIGGHRFFSKSDRVMEWWQKILPLQGQPAKDDILLGRKIDVSIKPGSPDPQSEDRVMLVRQRISRIFFLQKFFNYPISLSLNTLLKLGVVRTIKIITDYIKIRLFPIKEEKSLEDFYINRFGRELYKIFFKDYTEKLWGIACSQIKPDWGAQRVKGVSISKIMWQAIRSSFLKNGTLEQKNKETSLIEKFIYPKLGPGQLWEEVARIIKESGGEIYLSQTVVSLKMAGNTMAEAQIRNEISGEILNIRGDYFFSTMPIKDLINGLGQAVPAAVREVAKGLLYRDFLSVGLLLKKLRIKNDTKIKTINNFIPDTWIYIQEPGVKLGRIQVFNNWSPYLVADDKKAWLGLEYFCRAGDDFWSKTDEELAALAIDELVKINIAAKEDFLDSVVVRMEKAYPAYFGSYDQLQIIRDYLDKIENLYLIGRNGMHRYNNQDHSMLTAMAAVENIIKGIKNKDNIWSVNAEQDYHEEKNEPAHK
jgi:protoporphyrinogen oxidase